MKTLVRRAIACVLMFAIIFLLPQSMVNAVSTESKDTRPSVLYTDKNEVICTDLVQIINTMGVKINEETQISFTTLESQTNASAIMITNTTGSLVTTQIIFTLGQDGNIQDMQAYNTDVVTKSARAGGSGDHTYNGKIAIMGTAVYNYYRNQGEVYYQPIGMYFIYEKLSSCNVGYIEAEYVCCGFPYTYPGFVDLGGGNGALDRHSHPIPRRVSNPQENTIYDRTLPYRGDRVLYTQQGGPGVGQFMNFEYEVDSIIDSTTVTIDPNQDES